MAKPFHQRLRDAFHYRVALPFDTFRSRSLGWLKHRVWRRFVPFEAGEDVLLHVGCGREALPGWVNVDLQSYVEVDEVRDVTAGLPYSGVRLIFSEHFLEHLDVGAALDFLVEANRLLRDGGWLRLTTPNLDWVWSHTYSPENGGERLRRAMHANRAFYGWEHRFLWNRELLEEALRAAGFAEVRWCEYGRSSIPELDALERHERYPDTPELPHVLVAEARRGDLDTARLRALRELLHQEFLGSLRG